MANNSKQPLRFGPLGETKEEIMGRLRIDGRWPAFQSQRDEMRSQGVPIDEAWAQLAPQFQPLAMPREATEPTEVLTIDENFDPNSSPEIARDVAWVYNNFATAMTPAPSSGALNMLAWARSNRTAFFKDVLPKLKPVATDEDKRLRDDGRKLFDIVSRFRRANKLPQAELDAIAHCAPAGR